MPRIPRSERQEGLSVTHMPFSSYDAGAPGKALTALASALEAAIRALPEVLTCHFISGTGTFEAQVVATDIDAYSRWVRETLFKLPHVKDMHTSFSLGEVKAGQVLPLGHLRGPSAGST